MCTTFEVCGSHSCIFEISHRLLLVHFLTFPLWPTGPTFPPRCSPMNVVAEACASQSCPCSRTACRSRPRKDAPPENPHSPESQGAAVDHQPHPHVHCSPHSWVAVHLEGLCLRLCGLPVTIRKSCEGLFHSGGLSRKNALNRGSPQLRSRCQLSALCDMSAQCSVTSNCSAKRMSGVPIQSL